MSSALLYLAIVAIWAGVLMPKWLRPRSAQQRLHTSPLDESETVAAAPEHPAEPAQAARADAAPVARRGAEAGPAAPGRQASPGQAAGPGTPRTPPATADVRQAAPRRRASLADNRRRVLRARRRMLATLVLLTLGAVGIAAVHLAAAWVVAPPTVLLAGFLVLLREAAHTDAARAHDAWARYDTTLRDRTAAPAAAHTQTAASGAVAAVHAPAAVAETEPEPTAEIIDISHRIGDQLYDQYSDAAERAVGD